jgi:penicillin-binding protein 1A
MTMARALAQSNNIVAVKVLNELGPAAVIDMAQRMGIHANLENNLALTLGGSGVTLLDITSAFSVLANQGVRVEPYAIEKILDSSGNVVYQHQAMKSDVLNRVTVDTIVSMMMGVIQNGTGRAADIGRPMAGKTGTSDDYRDAWFIGFTPNIITGVWVGNDDNSSMPGMTGGGLPATIWKTAMRPYLADRMSTSFDLAYARALSQQDFITYNIDNLSDQETLKPDALTSTEQTTEVQDGQLEGDPNAPAMVDEAGNPLPPVPGPDGTVEGGPGSGPPTTPVDPMHVGSPQPGHASGSHPTPRDPAEFSPLAPANAPATPKKPTPANVSVIPVQPASTRSRAQAEIIPLPPNGNNNSAPARSSAR